MMCVLPYISRDTVHRSTTVVAATFKVCNHLCV